MRSPSWQGVGKMKGTFPFWNYAMQKNLQKQWQVQDIKNNPSSFSFLLLVWFPSACFYSLWMKWWKGTPCLELLVICGTIERPPLSIFWQFITISVTAYSRVARFTEIIQTPRGNDFHRKVLPDTRVIRPGHFQCMQDLYSKSQLVMSTIKNSEWVFPWKLWRLTDAQYRIQEPYPVGNSFRFMAQPGVLEMSLP
jgi:hypothetical protein